tara:strand:- start:3571 stop:4074 length:504 start_codon:yes stop_codon:yes gene_type:complete
MDISLNSMNDLNLQYLTNSTTLKRYNRMKDNALHYSEEDFKFYRKRILHLTKEMLKGNKSEHDGINAIFNNFVKLCIHNFKFIDKKDIIQEEYKEFKGSESLLKDIDMKEENKKIMRRKSLPGPKTIDTFIKVKKKKENKKMKLPQKKKIDIKNPELKNKGLVNRKI